MSKYLMKLTPQEMYFFGNEKTFVYPDKSKDAPSYRYYIKSEHTPSQTTLLGVLRYILLPIKKEYNKYTAEDIAANNAVVGSKSFCFGEENTFGKIKAISPLFLMNGDKRLIPTPFDHTPDNLVYTPYSNYISSLDGEFIYPNDYNDKKGLPNSFTCVDGNHEIVESSEIFVSETRVGINCSQKKNGFFKKEYVGLNSGYSFACFVTLEDDIVPQDTIAFLGQGKSLFTVSFSEVSDDADTLLINSVKEMLRPNITYCFGDAFLESSCYEKTKFAMTDFRDYRSYTTKYAKSKENVYYKSIKKDSVLYKLIKAGSIFILKDDAKLTSNTYVESFGFNIFINGGSNK